jgi:N-acetylmuramic acid 6-phosphate etherase
VVKAAKTEQRNPRTRGLDVKSTLEILQILNREDQQVALSVHRELPEIARAVDAIVEKLSTGGRLFYIGAGTSGRLAVLDAAECPPTFGTPRKMVQALIAGGTKALRGAVEGAEDSARNGARDLAKAGVTRKDVVIGIAASGTTPYVLGGVTWAKRRGCITVGVTSNRNSPLAQKARIVIGPQTGPEAVSGSTRLKAGTAQKMVLNLLSTTTMIQLGRVYENWMVHVALTNQKLRQRGQRILQEATGANASKARRTLSQAQHDLPAALVMLKAGVSPTMARRSLANSGGSVRKALELHRKQTMTTGSRGK